MALKEAIIVRSEGKLVKVVAPFGWDGEQAASRDSFGRASDLIIVSSLGLVSMRLWRYVVGICNANRWSSSMEALDT